MKKSVAIVAFAALVAISVFGCKDTSQVAMNEAKTITSQDFSQMTMTIAYDGTEVTSADLAYSNELSELTVNSPQYSFTVDGMEDGSINVVADDSSDADGFLGCPLASSIRSKDAIGKMTYAYLLDRASKSCYDGDDIIIDLSKLSLPDNMEEYIEAECEASPIALNEMKVESYDGTLCHIKITGNISDSPLEITIDME